MSKVRDVIAAAADAALAAAPDKSAKVLLEVPAELRAPMVRSEIERVFFNLLTNSMEARPAGVKIRIDAVPDGTNVQIVVEDNGPGIAPAIRDRLFEPFATAEKRNGLGLGLALSRQIVRAHGGDLWNEPAAGARFVMRLPR
jgi:signal transduction histidine kinase